MRTSCSLCPSPPRAHCPALNAPICGPCCGSKRNISIQCTADCRFNPFSPVNYDGWLRIDSGLSRKMLEYLSRFYDENEFQNIVREMMYDEDSSHALAMGSAVAVYYLFFRKSRRDGKTIAALWQTENWEGLNGDEQRMMEFRMNAAPALVEVQKVLDHQSMECRNLLQPERKGFVLLDRSIVGNKIGRFTRLWMWLADYPYFSRPACDPLQVPERTEKILLQKISKDVLKEFNKKNHALPDEMIAKNFGRYSRLILDESRKMRQRMLNAMDLHECKAFYTIKGPYQDVKRILDSKPDFRLDNEASPTEGRGPGLSYDWFRRGESKAIEESMPLAFRHADDEEGVGILGHLLIGEKELIVRTTTKRNFSFAKKMVEQYWGDLLEFHREAIVDLAKQMAESETFMSEDDSEDISNETAIPKEIEEKLMTGHYRKHYEIFLNDSIPALDGMTPRKAAKSPRMRPLLIELMKNHISSIDRINKTRGFSINIDWVLDELGLKELR